MKNILTIVKKEFYRIISDKRLFITVFVLPFLGIFIVYGVLGNAIENEISKTEEHKSIIYIYNVPENFDLLMNDLENIEISYFSDTNDLDMNKQKLLNGDIDLIVKFDENFIDLINDYENTSIVPNVSAYYNNTNMNSNSARQMFYTILNQYNDLLLSDRLDNPEDINVFSINSDGDDYIISDEKKEAGLALGMLLPLLIIIFIFSGSMSIGTEAIAGEKERGTIATLLLTPIKRSDIAWGKVIGISLISLITALSSFVGILGSTLFSKSLFFTGDSDIKNISYDLSHYIMLLIIILATTIFIVSIIVLISSYAKTIKEAGILITPVYLASMVACFSNYLSQEIPNTINAYLIPIYNSSNVIKGIFLFEISWWQVITAASALVIYSVVIIVLIQRMFKSEKIMFR